MTHSADHAEVAEQARRIYAEHLVKGLPAMVNSLAEAASTLLDKPSEHARFMRRRELVHELKKRVTILIVTHNMQQAARCSDYTAFMYLGELVEHGVTSTIFTKPTKQQTEDYITGRFG